MDKMATKSQLQHLVGNFFPRFFLKICEIILPKKSLNFCYNCVNLQESFDLQLYIHIPFCQNKCPYCAFGSVVSKEKWLIYEYFKCLINEFKWLADSFELEKHSLKTLFIGGGTPSATDAKFYEEIFKILEPFLSENAEISVEANPNSADFAWLKDMRNFGINRISFGAQSFDSKKLKFLGRIHTSKDTINAVFNAKKAGFSNISADLIYATKFDTKKLLSAEISTIKMLNLAHISAYSLTLEKNTPFFNKFSYAKNSPNLAKFLIKEIENLGFSQYEISNFGKICKHNLGYWALKNYLSLGAFGVGFVDNKRFYAPKNIKIYLKNPLEKRIEILNKEQIKFEKIFLGMRSKIGINCEILSQNELENAKFLVSKNKLFLKNGVFYNPNYLISDEISLFLSRK